MKVSAQTGQHKGIPVLHLADVLDIATQKDFELVVRQFETAGDRLILDMRDVSYIDSSPLGLLVGLHRRLSGRGGALAITSCRSGVGRVFEMAGLVGLLNLFDGLDQAAAYLESVCPRDAS